MWDNTDAIFPFYPHLDFPYYESRLKATRMRDRKLYFKIESYLLGE